MEQAAHSLCIKQLKTYYTHLFPYDSMVEWLSLSPQLESNLSRREFSFNIDLDTDE